MTERCPLCDATDPDMPNPIALLRGLFDMEIKVCDHPWHDDPWGDECPCR